MTAVGSSVVSDLEGWYHRSTAVGTAGSRQEIGFDMPTETVADHVAAAVRCSLRCRTCSQAELVVTLMSLVVLAVAHSPALRATSLASAHTEARTDTGGLMVELSELAVSAAPELAADTVPWLPHTVLSRMAATWYSVAPDCACSNSRDEYR